MANDSLQKKRFQTLDRANGISDELFLLFFKESLIK